MVWVVGVDVVVWVEKRTSTKTVVVVGLVGMVWVEKRKATKTVKLDHHCSAG